MSRRTTSLAVASLAIGSLLTFGSATASAQDHTGVALGFIGSAVVNDWGSPCVIDWSVSPPTGTTKGACFFSLVFKRAYGYADRDLQAMWGSSGPTSSAYFDFINTSPTLGSPAPAVETYFRKLTTARQIQRGDILAIGATDTYAGHTVIITGPAAEILPQVMPRYSGTKQYAVPVADSTNTSHGCNASYPDSRWRGPCTGGYMDPGAGTGYLRVYADSLTGVLLGFTWSVTSSLTSYYSPSTRPFRIGRLFKLPTPIQDPVDPPPPP